MWTGPYQERMNNAHESTGQKISDCIILVKVFFCLSDLFNCHLIAGKKNGVVRPGKEGKCLKFRMFFYGSTCVRNPC